MYTGITSCSQRFAIGPSTFKRYCYVAKNSKNEHCLRVFYQIPKVDHIYIQYARVVFFLILSYFPGNWHFHYQPEGPAATLDKCKVMMYINFLRYEILDKHKDKFV